MTRVTLAELIMHCSLASGPEAGHVNDTLYRVVIATSHGAPYSVTDATTGVAHREYDLDAVTTRVLELERMGHDVRIGLAGIPMSHVRELGRDVRQSLEPCVHVAMASVRLESVLTKASTSRVDTLHFELARYWSPKAPESAQSIAWAARVLAVPAKRLVVLYEAAIDGRSSQPRIYSMSRSPFPAGGHPKAVKWEVVE